MAADTSPSLAPSPAPAPTQRKQLKEGMEHLRGFVTHADAPTTEGDAYGVPSSLEPLRKPKSNHGPEDSLKRSDPFQFGSRYLEEGDDIFSYNAWDHVETDDAYKFFAEECYQKQREAPVSDFDRNRYMTHPEKMWDKFYANNSNNFFKNRKWLVQEFPVLGEVMQEAVGEKVVLEVGAGAGNTAFPLLKANRNPGLSIFACDFSRTAVEVIRGHEEYGNKENVGRIEASVWDAAAKGPSSEEPWSLPEGIRPGMVDVVVMVFIFSALSPEQWSQAVLNAFSALKPGGLLLFRDYGRGDLAQVRFKKGRWMGENFYVRGDGTRVYFFEEDELRRIWAEQGGFEVMNLGTDRRMLVNRQRRLKMYRCWMQAVFRKPGGGDGEKENGIHDPKDVEKLAEGVALAHISGSPG